MSPVGLPAMTPDNGHVPGAEGDVERSGAKPEPIGFPPLSSTRALSWPKPLSDAAYGGLVGRIVREVEPYTEADPAALLASLLVMFGNAVGRGPHFRAGDAEHATNLFVLVVGETSTGSEGHERGGTPPPGD